ncbi:MAG: pseudaminic acid cytidylyltransferase [Flavobacterium sp.]
MANLCIIPARGGSKRIPRKNIKLFLGKPIIAYSIQAAIESGLFDEVMVSTDDDEIAEIAVEYGAVVPFMRSEKAANDFATTFDVIDEVVKVYKDLGVEFENVCCIYSCAPFVNKQKLEQAYHLLLEQHFDSVFPVMRFGFPVQRSLIRDGLGKVDFFYPEFCLTRSQDFEPSFHDAGQFYWMNTKKCMQEQKILTANTGSIEISELEGQDIDNEVDWKLAELKYELLQSIK